MDGGLKVVDEAALLCRVGGHSMLKQDLTSTKAKSLLTYLNLGLTTSFPRPKCFVSKVEVHTITFDNSTE